MVEFQVIPVDLCTAANLVPFHASWDLGWGVFLPFKRRFGIFWMRTWHYGRVCSGGFLVVLIFRVGSAFFLSFPEFYHGC